MKALKIILATAGWFAVCSAFAQPGDDAPSPLKPPALNDLGNEDVTAASIGDLAPDVREAATAQEGLNILQPLEMESIVLENGSAGSGSGSPRIVVLSAAHKKMFGLDLASGYIGLNGAPALGPPVSHMRRFAGMDNPDKPDAGHWLHPDHATSEVLTLGYTWRELQVEGSAFTGRLPEERMTPMNDGLKLGSRSARLTFKPSPNWSVQFSKGSLSGLDQVVAGADVRRTTLSSTYRYGFTFGEWETTLAWGRNARKGRETTVGYMAESSLRVNHAHIVFGRFERAGSDELLRENESWQRLPFKLNKLTLGYFQEIKTSPNVSVDAGALVSRYLVPSHVAPAYGRDPTACMFFVRLKFR